MGNSAKSNVRWAATAQAGRVGIQFASIIIFSRLLAPSDYGLMAMAAVVINFGGLFRDMGTSTALIQRKELTGSLLDTVFWLNVVLGVSVGVVAAVMAPLAARLFSADSLTGIVLALAVIFPIMGSTAPHLALLERRSEFRLITRIEISAGVIGLLAGVIFAYMGGGVYSFVLQGVVTAAVSAIQLWQASTLRPGMSWHGDELAKIWRFSGNLFAFNFVNYFVRNADSALVGRFLGPVSLGWYSVANRLLLFPIQNLTAVVNRALLPVYSRRQENRAEIADLYLRTLALVAAVSAPMMFGLWALREPFVFVLLGPKWLPVSDILAWFAPMGFLQSLLSTTGTILSAIGRTDLLRTLAIANTLIVFGGFLLGLRYGLLGIVAAYFFATVIVTVSTMHVTLKKIDSGLPALIRAVATPSLCAALMAAAIAAAGWFLDPVASHLVVLVVLIPLGVMIYAGLMFAFARPLIKEVSAAVWR